jgi:predicted DNA-binding transcriptional regulator AlpA
MTPDRLLTASEASSQAGISRRLLYLLMRGGQFPRQVHIGAAARWSEREVQAWIAERLAGREGPAAEERRTA